MTSCASYNDASIVRIRYNIIPERHGYFCFFWTHRTRSISSHLHSLFMAFTKTAPSVPLITLTPWYCLQHKARENAFYFPRTIPLCNNPHIDQGLGTWWRYQMERFSALLVFSEGNPPVTGGFPSQMLVTWSADVFFDLRLNKRLSKQTRRRWFETQSRSLWCHCNDEKTFRKWFLSEISVQW